MAGKRPNVIIVGGGIGGLFAANALIAQGLDVSVYEQAPALGEVGAGVFITPNSARHLQRVGLGPSLEKWGARALAPDRSITATTVRQSRRYKSRIRPAGTRPSACTAPTSSICWRTPSPAALCIPAIAVSASSRPAIRLCISFANGNHRRGRCRHLGRWHPLRIAPLRSTAIEAGVPRLGRLSRCAAAASADPGLADRRLVDVASAKANTSSPSYGARWPTPSTMSASCPRMKR